MSSSNQHQEIDGNSVSAAVEQLLGLLVNITSDEERDIFTRIYRFVKLRHEGKAPNYAATVMAGKYRNQEDIANEVAATLYFYEHSKESDDKTQFLDKLEITRQYLEDSLAVHRSLRSEVFKTRGDLLQYVASSGLLPCGVKVLDQYMNDSRPVEINQIIEGKERFIDLFIQVFVIMFQH